MPILGWYRPLKNSVSSSLSTSQDPFSQRGYSKGTMGRHGDAKAGHGQGENEGDDVSPVGHHRDGPSESFILEAARRQMRDASDPGEPDRTNGQVLLSLEEPADGGRLDEECMPQARSVLGVDPCAQKPARGHQAGRERHRQPRSPLRVSKKDGGMQERRYGKPSHVSVDVLRHTQHQLRDQGRSTPWIAIMAPMTGTSTAVSRTIAARFLLASTKTRAATMPAT